MIAGLKILEIVLPMIALTSPPDSAWSLSASHGRENWSFAAVETADHHYVQVGYTTPDDDNNRDGWVVASDSEGKLLWERTYGDDREDVLLTVLNQPDGGLLMAGHTASFGNGQQDVWIINTDSQGKVRWERTYGGPGRDIAWDIKPAENGGYVLSGSTEIAGQMDGLLLRIAENGDSLWACTYGESGSEEFIHLAVVNDGYLLAGSTASNSVGPRDGWALKTDKQGKQLWSWKSSGIGTDILRAAIAMTDSTYCFAGHTDTYGAGSNDFWLVSLSADGDSLWNRTYGGVSRDMCFYADKTDEGYAVLCGHTFSFGSGMADAWLLKVNASGDSIWSRTFGGNMNDDAYFVFPTKNNEFVLSGYTRSFAEQGTDFWLIKTGPDTAAVYWVKPDHAALQETSD